MESWRGAFGVTTNGQRHKLRRFCHHPQDGMVPSRFVDGKNYAWIEFPGDGHSYDCWALDLYNSLLASI